MAIPESFLTKLATRLGVAPEAYGAFVEFMNAWQPYEGGWDKNSAEFNPLNTTQNFPGATSMNSVGVKAYPSEDAGVEATAQTLENGYYPNLLAGLKSGGIDAARVAPEIATWGTKTFANQLAGGEVAAQGGGMDPKTQEVIDKLQDQLMQLLENPPELNPEYPEDLPRDQQAWADSLSQVGALLKQLRAGDISGQNAETEFNQRIAAAATDIAYDNLNLDKATAAIDRYLSGKGESRARADLVQRSKEAGQKYGTTGGKASFSARDLGGIFEKMAAQSGMDPAASMIRYGGVTTLDPEGDLARMDAEFGVGGALPGIPDLTSTAFSASQPWSPPASAPLSAASAAPWDVTLGQGDPRRAGRGGMGYETGAHAPPVRPPAPWEPSGWQGNHLLKSAQPGLAAPNRAPWER